MEQFPFQIPPVELQMKGLKGILPFKSLQIPSNPPSFYLKKKKKNLQNKVH